MRPNRPLTQTALAAAIGMTIPTEFETRPGGPDATLDGGEDIAPGPGEIAGLPDTPAELNRAIAAGVERQMSGIETRHAQQLETVRAEAAEQAVVSRLQALIDGNPGDDLASTQFRSEIQGLLLATHSRGDKPLQEFVDQATQLHQARMQVLLERNGDGSGDPPQVRAPNRETDGQFDVGMFMHSLGQQVLRDGDNFSGDELKGSPELEFTQQLLDGNAPAKQRFQRLSSRAGNNQRVVPIPAFALTARPAEFAESYGTDVATRREPTYRRDALVSFFRPSNVLQALGVPQPMISNDITLPRLSGSLSAAWLAENADITEGNLTVVELTTSPKRLGVYDPISWMLLAAGDSQFGHQPLVVSEMARAVMQAKEAAVYGPAITNGPTGIRGTTGINASDLGTTDPTYNDLLGMITTLANANLPVEMVRFAINPNMRQLLSTIQRFTSGASILNDVVFREPMSGPADIGMYGGPMVGTIAGHPCAVTTHIPTEGSGDTYIYAALWQYVWCIDYSVAFMTIDDISSARQGQTNITVNSYADVANRFPAAFNVVTHDTI